MNINKLKLSQINGKLADSDAELTCYIMRNSMEFCPEKRRKAIIICPGGGYRFTSDREAEPVAMAFLNEDIQAFVLRYSVDTVRYPQQLLELAAAMAYIKKNCVEFGIDPQQIAVCGFSAGGHLAASLGTLWNRPFIAQTLGIQSEDCRPQVMILSYPVITAGEFAHEGSFEHLLGDARAEKSEEVSLEKQVSSATCPAFIWHTYQDSAVPVENTLFFSTALRQNAVPFELAIYTSGPHGLSLCNSTTARDGNPQQINPHAAKWFKQCIEWWSSLDTQLLENRKGAFGERTCP